MRIAVVQNIVLVVRDNEDPGRCPAFGWPTPALAWLGVPNVIARYLAAVADNITTQPIVHRLARP